MKEKGRYTWKSKVDELIRRYNKTRDALLPCLEAVQHKANYIPQEAITYISRILNVPSVNIYGMITFYGMLTTKKQGKYVIRICNSLPCYLNGSREIIDILEDKLGVKSGETTPNGRFTLETVACLGLCDKAPAMMVNEEIYGNLTEGKIKHIIEVKKQKE